MLVAQDRFHVCVPEDVTVLYCVTTCIEVANVPVSAVAEYADDHDPRKVSVSAVTDSLVSIPATMNTASFAGMVTVDRDKLVLSLDGEVALELVLDGFFPEAQAIL